MGSASVGLTVALLLCSAPAGADLPGGVPLDDWLRTGGAVLDLQVAPGNTQVELDGDRLHPGPVLVTAGVHLLVARAPGRRELREVVQLPAGRRTRKRIALTAHPVTGQLDLRTSPRHARVLIDGRLMGSTPRLLTLVAGRHQLVVVATGYRAAKRLVRVPRGATLTLRGDLQAEGRRRRRPRVAMVPAPVRDTVGAWVTPSSSRPVAPSVCARSWSTSTTGSSRTF